MSDLSFVRKFYSEKRLEKDNEMPTTTTSVGLEMTFSLNISVLVSLSTVNRQLSIQTNFVSFEPLKLVLFQIIFLPLGY